MADRKRILVADDDPDLLDLMQTCLGAGGHEILTAANGKDALQVATTQKVDLVMLDVMMPYIDGYHVASEITAKLGSNSPKIVIMTSRDTEKEKGIAFFSGAAVVLQKPFTIQQLNSIVAKLLEPNGKAP